MFGFFPPIVGDIMVLASFILGPSGFIWALLQRKGANRSLVVEEGGLEVNQFNTLTTKYADLLSRAETAATKAEAEAEAARASNAAMQGQIDALSDDLREVRSLFMDVVRQHGIKLTPEQQRRFEATKPPRARTRPRPA